MMEDDEENHRLRQLVNIYRNDIIKDLTVDHVIPVLLQEFVLEYEDKQLVDKQETGKAKADKLLDVLLAKSKLNCRALHVFKSALKVKYSWLHNKLSEDVPDFRIVPAIKINDFPYRSSSEVGGVPSLPAVNIERKDLLEDVVSKLLGLKRNQYLVIQGMTGCGKSVLATQAAHKLLAGKTPFEGKVYWLSMGKECNDNNDALLGKMRILCDKLDVNRAPKSLDHGKEILKDAFATRSDSLLVLDNVWSHRVIRNFDIGCRVMVTTQDMSVMDVVNGRLAFTVVVAEGFQEAESLNFFREALGFSAYESLPEEAKLIHQECKGSPMVISLIASLLEDHGTSRTEDTSRWNHYYESISRRKFSGIRKIRPYEHASIFDAISLSFNNLEEKKQLYYQDFGLFQDDVEIPCQVLQTLWSKSKHETEDVMKTFVRKSLAVELYDAVQNSFVYSLHDLQLDYLKYRVHADNSEKEKELHAKFINKYSATCKGEFHKLPDDGYIHFHIGYHIYKSGQTDLFPKIYLDLKFIGEKLRITGPADLLVDLRKYRNLILNSDEDVVLLEELEAFTQQVGYKMYGQHDMDIVQMAIQTPRLPRLSKLARQVALSLPSRMYIDWMNSNSTQWKHSESTVLCEDFVCCAKFVGCNGSLFIVGLSNGDIKLCDFRASAVCHIFKGHADAVNSVSVFCPQIAKKQHTYNGYIQNQSLKHVFVSASADATCKLWELTSHIQKFEAKTEFSDSEPSLDDQSPSPKLLKNRMWSFESLKDESYASMDFHTAAVDYVEFSPDGTKLVSVSRHELLTWLSSNRTVLFKISLDFTSCHFPLNNSSFLLGTCENKIVLISTQKPSVMKYVYAHFLKIVALLFRTEDTFCTVSENEIGLWRVVTKAEPDKTRRLVVSPRSSVPLINGQSLAHQTNTATGGSLGDFLHPETAAGGRRSGSSRSSNGDIGGSYKVLSSVNSPSGRPDLIEFISGQIEVNGVVTQILLEQSITKENTGLFNCAAIDSVYGDGDLLACGTYDHKVVLLQLDKLVFLGEFTAHNGSVTTLCFSPVEEFSVLTGSNDQTVKVWDVANEEKEETEPKKTHIFASVPHDDCIIGVQPDFVTLCATDRRTVQIYIGDHFVHETCSLPSRVSCLGLLPNGSHGVVGTEEGQVYWLKNVVGEGDCRYTSKATLILGGCHESEVVSCSFGNNTTVLATGSHKDILIFMDFEPHWRLPLKAEFGNLVSLDFCHRDLVLVICCESYVGVKNVEKKTKMESPEAVPLCVTCSALSRESNKFVIGSEQGTIHIFELKKDFGTELFTTLRCKHNSPVRSVALSAGGDKVAVGHDNGLITIWNIESMPMPDQEKDLIFHKSRVNHVMFSKRNFGESPWLMSCGNQLAFWSLEKSVEKLRKTTYMEERRRRKSGDGSRSSSRLSMEVGAEVKIGRQGKRELLQTFTFHGNQAYHVACDLGFTRFVTVDDCGIFYILDVM